MSDPIENAISAEHSHQERAWEERMTSPISDALTALCAAFDLDPSYFHISEAEKRSYLNSMGGLFDSQIDRILSAMKAKEEAAKGVWPNCSFWDYPCTDQFCETCGLGKDDPSAVYCSNSFHLPLGAKTYWPSDQSPADEVETPFAYAYRYPAWPPEGATVIRFGTQGREINGSKPIETIPLYRHPAIRNGDEGMGQMTSMATDNAPGEARVRSNR